jgi:hypothetical protein
MHLTWQQRLVTGLALIVGILAVSNGISVNRLEEQQRVMRSLTESTSPYLIAVQTAQLEAKAAANDERGFLLRGDTMLQPHLRRERPDGQPKTGHGRQALDGGALAAKIAPTGGAHPVGVCVQKEFGSVRGQPGRHHQRWPSGANRDLRKDCREQELRRRPTRPRPASVRPTRTPPTTLLRASRQS